MTTLGVSSQQKIDRKFSKSTLIHHARQKVETRDSSGEENDTFINYRGMKQGSRAKELHLPFIISTYSSSLDSTSRHSSAAGKDK